MLHSNNKHLEQQSGFGMKSSVDKHFHTLTAVFSLSCETVNVLI